jgi:hypothetical protein
MWIKIHHQGEIVNHKIEPAAAIKFNPDSLLDALHTVLRLKNDAALARLLEVGPPLISKIRHRRMSIGGGLLIRIHEVTGICIADLQVLMGDRRRKFRISDVQGRPKQARTSHATWPAPVG